MYVIVLTFHVFACMFLFKQMRWSLDGQNGISSFRFYHDNKITKGGCNWFKHGDYNMLLAF